MRRVALTAVAVVLGTAGSVLVGALVFGDAVSVVVCVVFLLAGPAWALALAAASDDEDFAGTSRSRSGWLDLLPWTFLLAPLVLPNVVILGSFIRDARADGGRTPLTWDRMRPGEAEHDVHWPG